MERVKYELCMCESARVSSASDRGVTHKSRKTSVGCGFYTGAGRVRVKAVWRPQTGEACAPRSALRVCQTTCEPNTVLSSPGCEWLS